jgi:hypothetical protein
LVEEPLACLEEAPSQADGIGVFVVDSLKTRIGAAIDRGVGVGEDDRRVGGDDELGAVLDEFVNAP